MGSNSNSDSGNFNCHYQNAGVLRKIILIFIVTMLILIVPSQNKKISCDDLVNSTSNLTNYFKLAPTSERKNNNFTIAVLDTGVNMNIIADKNILLFKDFVNNNKTPYDDNGHGTEIVSVMTGDKKKYTGINDSLNIISLKIIDKNSLVRYSSLLDSLQWIIENYRQYNIKFACMSMGFDQKLYNDKYLLSLYNEILEKGIFIVTSAGNTGNNILTFPALIKGVFSVGSLNYNPKIHSSILGSKRSEFSCYNNVMLKPDFYAPGENIVVPFSQTKETYNKCHNVVSGTSYSTSIVCAQLASIFQTISVEQYDFINIITNYIHNSLIFGDNIKEVDRNAK